MNRAEQIAERQKLRAEVLEGKWLELLVLSSTATELFQTENPNFNPKFTTIDEMADKVHEKARAEIEEWRRGRYRYRGKTNRKPWFKDKDVGYAVLCFALWIGLLILIATGNFPGWSAFFTFGASFVFMTEFFNRLFKRIGS